MIRGRPFWWAVAITAAVFLLPWACRGARATPLPCSAQVSYPFLLPGKARTFAAYATARCPTRGSATYELTLYRAGVPWAASLGDLPRGRRVFASGSCVRGGGNVGFHAELLLRVEYSSGRIRFQRTVGPAITWRCL